MMIFCEPFLRPG